jgi:''chromo'' (CHRromatin Organisation MOdifier) domain.
MNLKDLCHHQPSLPQNQIKKNMKLKTILDKRTLRNRPQYLVKWKGYPLHNATWEPLENLENAKEMVKEFEAMRTLHS